MSVILSTVPAAPIAVNGFFDVSVVTSSDGPLLTGLDFTLDLTHAVLLDRDFTGSDFPDLVKPGLGGDLGASVNDVSQPLGPGDHLVARLYFRVEGAGQVSLQPKEASYVTQAPQFAEYSFDALRGSTVMIPEPGGLAITFALFLVAALWCRASMRKGDK